jgi:hypothetical protein
VARALPPRASQRRASFTTPTDVRLLGVAEVAELLGISRASLADRRNALGFRQGWAQMPFAVRRVPFPEPIAQLRCGPIWQLEQILDYATEKGLKLPAGAASGEPTHARATRPRRALAPRAEAHPKG